MADLTRRQFCPGGLIDARHLTHCAAHPKGPMMTTISDKDRAEAQAMFEVYHGRDDLAALSDSAVLWWLAVRDHVLAAHECPTVPVWRPVIDGEDLTGYEVRSRGRDRDVWHTWGVAARRRDEGRWVTEGGWMLDGWPVVETTAPLPEPKPWDEELVGVVGDALAGTEDPGPHWGDDARRVLDALAARGYLERAAITKGEQS